MASEMARVENTLKALLMSGAGKADEAPRLDSRALDVLRAQLGAVKKLNGVARMARLARAQVCTTMITSYDTSRILYFQWYEQQHRVA
jgi:hypothetical protein